MKFLIKKNLNLFIFLIPLSYIIGVAITELFVFLSVIFFLFFNRDKTLILNSKIFFLLLFSLYISLNAYFQIIERSEDLLLSSLFYFRFIIFAVSIFYISELLTDFQNNRYLLMFIFILLILIIDSIFQFFNGVNFLGYELIQGRVSSFFKDELILGSFLIRLLPIFFWFIFFFKVDLKKNKYYLIIFLSLYFISIYLSAGRTSFFLLIVMTILVFLIIKKLRKILSFSILVFLIFVLCISYFNLGYSNPGHKLFVKTLKQIGLIEFSHNNNNNDFSKDIKIYSNDHEGHIKLALKLFDENKIFGVGPRGFRYYCRGVNYDPNVGICSTHPHNILIQIVSELGLIGLLFYIIAAIYVIFFLLRSILNKSFSSEYLAFYSATLGLIINLFPFIPSGSFFNNWNSIILYYNIGIYLYSHKRCVLT